MIIKEGACMAEKEYGKVLETIELEDIDLKSVSKHAQNGTIDQIENELAILGGINAIIPNNLLGKLTEDEFILLVLFTSNEIYCEFTNKKTYGDILSSYIMTFYDQDTPKGKSVKFLVDKSFERERVFLRTEKEEGMNDLGEFSKTKEVYNERYKIKSMQYYLKLKAEAIAFWNNKSLQNNVKTVKELINGNISEIERFNDMVFEKAMTSTDESIQARFASIYSKNKGLDKTKNVNIINMYENYGGKERVGVIAQVTGQRNLQLDAVLEAESVEIGDEDGD
jgi:hypothetical protein